MDSKLYLRRTLKWKQEVLWKRATIYFKLHYRVSWTRAGKTELLESLAQQLGTSSVTAPNFVNLGAQHTNAPLIIDAVDELSKLDQSGIIGLLASIKTANLSCRSC